MALVQSAIVAQAAQLFSNMTFVSNGQQFHPSQEWIDQMSNAVGVLVYNSLKEANVVGTCAVGPVTGVLE